MHKCCADRSCQSCHCGQPRQRQLPRLPPARLGPLEQSALSACGSCPLTSSSRIFCTMKVATVLDSSLPISMVRRHRGMISVDSRKLMTSVSSTWRQWRRRQRWGVCECNQLPASLTYTQGRQGTSLSHVAYTPLRVAAHRQDAMPLQFDPCGLHRTNPVARDPTLAGRGRPACAP